MCEPVTMLSTGLKMAGQVQQHNAAASGVKSRNRAKLRNFDEQNRQYDREVLLDNAKWKNDVQVQDVEQDQVYAAMVNQWTERDLQLDRVFAEGDKKIENAITQMYENDYAGTQTGATAARLAGKSAKKLGQYKSKVLHSMMMAKEETAVGKDADRQRAQWDSVKLFERIRFSPIHGRTPMAPELEAGPSKSALILGLATSAVGGFSRAQDLDASKYLKDMGGANEAAGAVTENNWMAGTSSMYSGAGAPNVWSPNAPNLNLGIDYEAMSQNMPTYNAFDASQKIGFQDSSLLSQGT